MENAPVCLFYQKVWYVTNTNINEIAVFYFNISDKMEAAAAVITSQRSSTGSSNSTASTESQSNTPATVKTSTTGSETGQTSTVASSTANRSVGSTPVSSTIAGMFTCYILVLDAQSSKLTLCLKLKQFRHTTKYANVFPRK